MPGTRTARAHRWDTFARTPGNIEHGDTGDVANDHYHRYGEDFDELVGAGIEPFARLYHWDLPQRLQDQYGGWQSANIPKTFTEYAGYVAEQLSDRACLGQLQRATSEGVPVDGYFLWSAQDNFEWTAGYGNRFGMIYVDFESPQRIPKLSAECSAKPRARMQSSDLPVRPRSESDGSPDESVLYRMAADLPPKARHLMAYDAAFLRTGPQRTAISSFRRDIRGLCAEGRLRSRGADG